MRACQPSGPCIESKVGGHSGAVREFLSDENRDVRAAAIHSAGLWRDTDAVQLLIERLAGNDAQLRRLSAMALGRIGNRAAVKALVNSFSEEMDPFLKHAIIYALYEIGDNRNLPTDHPVGRQVRLMQEVNQRNITPIVFPEIQLADVPDPSPDKIARQKRTPR